jgi:hypothetical protein
MILILHDYNPQTMCNPTAQDIDRDYHAVATVDTDDLDEAFRLTNTIDTPWWENDGVAVVSPVRCTKLWGMRSTSVGDVMIRHNVCWIVAAAGFALVTDGYVLRHILAVAQ